MGKVVEAAIDAEAEIARLKVRIAELTAPRRTQKVARLVGGPKDGHVVALDEGHTRYARPLVVPMLDEQRPWSLHEASDPYGYRVRTGRYEFVKWMHLDPSMAIFEWMGDR